MPSPVGHALMGYILYQSTPGHLGTQWTRIGLFVFAANAPDLDFVPGLLVGDLSKFHHGVSHSIGFAILFGLIAAFFFSRRLYAFMTGFSLYLSHVVLDYLVQDPSPPHGVPLFWPLSYEYYMAPFAFFPRFDYMSSATESLFSPIFSLHNLLTVLIESSLLLPLLILVLFVKKRLNTPAQTI